MRKRAAADSGGPLNVGWPGMVFFPDDLRVEVDLTLAIQPCPLARHAEVTVLHQDCVGIINSIPPEQDGAR
jgi:hypothetical protein